MKYYMIYLLPILFFTINAEISWAESSAETVDLDITMEMLDEDAESASDIVNVIELPVQLMQQEQNSQKTNTPRDDAQRAVINNLANDAQRTVNTLANDAQRSANDAMRPQKGQ